MRALGYFRAEDGPSHSRDLEQAFLDYCDTHLHQPVATFGDVGADDSGPLPEYQRMLDRMRDSGGGFLVVVPDAGHLGSDVESVVRKLVELEGLGAKVTCADDDLPDPLQGALRTLGVKGVSQTRSQRILESMRARALEGQGLGRPPYGYRNSAGGGLKVVPEEAKVVRSVYRLYTDDGLGLRLIAQHLNEGGTPTRRGGRWSVVAIRDILRNLVYMGTYTRYGLRRPKSHEAIVTPELFRAAQDETRARRPVSRLAIREPFLLSGLVYCVYCGNRMMGVTRRQTWKRKDGRRARGVYRYYQCQSKNNMSVCDYHTWRASQLEDVVLTELRHVLGRTRSDRSSRDRSAELESSRASDVRNAERRLLRAVRRAARGELTVEMLAKYVEGLDAARGRATDASGLAGPTETLADWESLDMSARQSVLAGCVTRIVVRDDAVELVV
ncbi:MAG: recombinase family protein [Chloroflexi bacterium]|nr:recombinase family protein [Chloroflexota bacterium]